MRTEQSGAQRCGTAADCGAQRSGWAPIGAAITQRRRLLCCQNSIHLLVRQFWTV